MKELTRKEMKEVTRRAAHALSNELTTEELKYIVGAFWDWPFEIFSLAHRNGGKEKHRRKK